VPAHSAGREHGEHRVLHYQFSVYSVISVVKIHFCSRLISTSDQEGAFAFTFRVHRIENVPFYCVLPKAYSAQIADLSLRGTKQSPSFLPGVIARKKAIPSFPPNVIARNEAIPSFLPGVIARNEAIPLLPAWCHCEEGVLPDDVCHEVVSNPTLTTDRLLRTPS